MGTVSYTDPGDDHMDEHQPGSHYMKRLVVNSLYKEFFLTGLAYFQSLPLSLSVSFFILHFFRARCSVVFFPVHLFNITQRIKYPCMFEMVKITSVFILSALAFFTSAAPLERRIAQNTPDSKALWEAACVSFIFYYLT